MKYDRSQFEVYTNQTPVKVNGLFTFGDKCYIKGPELVAGMATMQFSNVKAANKWLDEQLKSA